MFPAFLGRLRIRLNHRAAGRGEGWRFALGQVALTGINALTGFVLVRGLNKEDYAVYSLTFSLLSIAVNATNMGLTSAVMGMGGRVWPDTAALGAVVRSAQRLRNRIGIGFALPFAVYCCWQFPRIGVAIGSAMGLTVVVLAAAWVQMQANFYAIALQLAKKLRSLLANDLLSALLKWIGVILLLKWHLSASAVIGWIACCLALNAWAHFRSARSLLPGTAVWEERYSAPMRALVRSNALRTLYWSFEGQIAILLCAWFSSAERLADIGALGRFSVLFGIFQAFVGGYILPDLAKAQTPRRVLRQALQTLLAAMGLILPILLWAAMHPPSLLWLLGSNYAGLNDYLLPFLLASALGQLAAVVYQICTARAWLSLNRFYVPLVLPLQIGLLYLLDVRKMEHVILFSGLNNLFFLLFNVTMFLLSWRREFAQEK